ncbi:MAG: formyltransferase family protein [Burkholderiaceae bacterium]
MKIDALLLMHPPFADQILARTRQLDKFGEVCKLANLAELGATLPRKRWQLLISFGFGEVVPIGMLRQPSLLAFNIHAAPPGYPGRDPHHFAAYDDVSQYGATLHYMSAVVDQGPIVDVELGSVPSHSKPLDLFDYGNAAGLRLASRFLDSFDPELPPRTNASHAWSKQVRKRRDFHALCKVDSSMSPAEFSRRRRAAAMPGYANLWTEVHGIAFRVALPDQ